MKKQVFYVLSILTVLCTLLPSLSYSLERDYTYTGAQLDDDWDTEEEDEIGNYDFYQLDFVKNQNDQGDYVINPKLKRMVNF